jgi:hypothetical protein
MPETVPFAIVEIDKRGVAKVSVFVGQNEAVRLTGVKRVYVNHSEQKGPCLLLIPVHTFKHEDDIVHITTPDLVVVDRFANATINILDHILSSIPAVAKETVKETLKEVLKSLQPMGGL